MTHDNRRPITRSNGTWLNLLHSRQLTGRRAIVSSAIKPGTVTGSEDHTSSREAIRQAPDATASGPINELRVNEEPVENTDPMKARFWKRGRTRWQRRITFIKRAYRAVRVKLKPTYGMSDEELERYNATRVEAEERKTLNKFHKTQARLCKISLTNVLKRTPSTRHIRSDNRLDWPRFDITLYNPLEYRYHVGHWPDGVSVLDMNNVQVGTDMSESVGRRVRMEFTYDAGLWVCVEVASTMGVPEHVDYRDMVANIPEDTRSPLTFPIGQGVNGKRIYGDLLTAPHMVIAGSSGFGKSNAQNSIACTLISNNHPDAVKLVMIDMKGGMEYGPYEGIPHLYPLEWKQWKSNGVIFTSDEASFAVEAIHAEAKRRFEFIRNENAKAKRVYKSVMAYNRNRKPQNRIPLIVVFVDEFTTLNDSCSAVTMNKLRAISNLARAVGIHIVAGSQYPKSDVFDTKLMVNFPCRLAFQLPPNASQAVLYDRSASEMQRPGQAIWQSPTNKPTEICVQVPFLPDETFMQILNDARRGRRTNVNDMTTLGLEEIVTWAMRNNEGRLNVRAVRRQFGDRAPDSVINDLIQAADDQVFDVDGVARRVINRGGSVGRIIVMDDDQSRGQAFPTRTPQTGK